MPTNWLSIDRSFPTFTGKESPEQQIGALHNYLFQLREGLQYSLQNLTSENFNEAAWQNIQESQKNEITREMEKVYAALNQLSGTVTRLTGRVSDAEKEIGTLKGRADTVDQKITDAEANVEGLADWAAALQESQSDHEQRILALEQQSQKLSGILVVNEDGSAVLGTEGKDLCLKGTLYINGVAYTQGESA